MLPYLTMASGNAGMAAAMLFMGIVWFVMPVTAVAGALVAWFSTRSGVSWPGVATAAGVFVMPYVLAGLVAGFEGVGLLLEVAFSPSVEGGLLALSNPLAAIATAAAVVRRLVPPAS